MFKKIDENIKKNLVIITCSHFYAKDEAAAVRGGRRRILTLGISDQEVSKGFKFWYLRPRG